MRIYIRQNLSKGKPLLKTKPHRSFYIFSTCNIWRTIQNDYSFRERNTDTRCLIWFALFYLKKGVSLTQGMAVKTKLKKWLGLDGDWIHGLKFGLGLRRSNHWATKTPHLNRHIQLRYHSTVNNVPLPDSPAAAIQSSLWLPASDTHVTLPIAASVCDSVSHSYSSPLYLLSMVTHSSSSITWGKMFTRTRSCIGCVTEWSPIQWDFILHPWRAPGLVPEYDRMFSISSETNLGVCHTTVKVMTMKQRVIKAKQM